MLGLAQASRGLTTGQPVDVDTTRVSWFSPTLRSWHVHGRGHCGGQSRSAPRPKRCWVVAAQPELPIPEKGSGGPRATPRRQAALCVDRVGHGDLLGTAGQVGLRSVLHAAVAQPGLAVELQAAVVAIAGVDG